MASPSSPPESSPTSPPSNPPQAMPLALPAPPQSTPQSQPSAPSSSRRLPPPCWSHDETVALIDSYREKWYSLRRGNLKATHWQEVADSVARRCPAASPAKTAVQCRHKMEKLRKRYRTEIQRAQSMPVSRFTSSWVHFKRMDNMEKGPSAKPENSDSFADDDDHDNDDEEDDPDKDLFQELKYGSNTRSVNKLYRNGVGGNSSGGGGSGSGGFRIKIPTGVSIAQPGTKVYAKLDPKFGMNPNSNSTSGPSYGGTKVMRECNSARPVLGKRERERDRDPMSEMVAAIKVLGDGFVRMEQMKMEMAKDIETMRMDMEMKRTEMILESQQRIVEAFAKAVSEKKKKTKRMPTPEA